MKNVILLISSLMMLSACGGSSDSSPLPTEPALVADKLPNEFTFEDRTDVQLSIYIESAEVTISGIDTEVDIVVEGGEFSINSAVFTNASGTIKNGDKLTFRHLSSENYDSSTETIISVGDYNTDFKSITTHRPVDDAAPQANISFPLESTSAFGKPVTVKGTVSDKSEVVELRVNDKPVTLTPVSKLTQKRARTTSSSNDSANEYEWESTVTPDKHGSYTINVATTDSEGNTNLEAASSNVYIPVDIHQMDFDEGTNSIYGIRDKKLYRINQSEKSISQLSPENAAYYAQAFHLDAKNRQIFTIDTAGRVITIYRTVLNDDSSVTIQKLFEDTELYTEDLIFGGSAYSESRNKLALGFLSHKQTPFKIVEIDIESFNVKTLIEKQSENQPYNLKYVSGKLVVTSGYVIDTYSPDSGELLSSWRIDSYTNAIEIGKEANQIYVADFDAIYSFNIETGAITYLKVFEEGSLQSFAQPRKLMLDTSANQLLIYDSSYTGIQAFSLSEFELTKYYSVGRGTGPRLIASRAMDITNDGKTLFVFDDGFNASPAIFKVDLNTGNRTLLTKLARDSIYVADELILDEENNRLFILSNNIIQEVNIESGSTAAFDSINTPAGVYMENMGAMALDSSSNTLYVADNINSTIVKIDINTKARTLISSSDSEGGVIPMIVDITIRSPSNSLLVLSQLESELYEVSLESGDRTKILDQCIGKFGNDILNDQTTASDMFYFDKEDTVYIQAYTLLKYEFASGLCSPSGGNNISFNGDLIIDGQGHMFTTEQNKIKQVEFDTGSEVVISQF